MISSGELKNLLRNDSNIKKCMLNVSLTLGRKGVNPLTFKYFILFYWRIKSMEIIILLSIHFTERIFECLWKLQTFTFEIMHQLKHGRIIYRDFIVILKKEKWNRRTLSEQWNNRHQNVSLTIVVRLRPALCNSEPTSLISVKGDICWPNPWK